MTFVMPLTLLSFLRFIQQKQAATPETQIRKRNR